MAGPQKTYIRAVQGNAPGKPAAPQVAAERAAAIRAAIRRAAIVLSGRAKPLPAISNPVP